MPRHSASPVFIYDQHSYQQTDDTQKDQKEKAKSHASRVSHERWLLNHYKPRLAYAARPRRLYEASPISSQRGSAISQTPLKHRNWVVKGASVRDEGESGLSRPESDGTVVIPGCTSFRTTDTAWQRSDGYKKDPFDCMPGSDHPDVVLALDFLAETESCVPKDAPFDVYSIYGTWVMEPMSIHKDVFHLCVVLIKLTTLRQAGVALDAAAHKDIYWRHQSALAALRKRIAAITVDDDDSIILSMWLLSVLCAALGDITTKKLHETSMRNLIKRRHGTQNLKVDRYLRRAMVQVNHYEELIARSSPPNLTYPDLPLGPRDIFLRSLPPGFRNVASVGFLSYETMATIHKLAQTRTHAPVTGQPHDEIVSTPPCLVLERESMHLYFDLANECPALALPDDANGSNASSPPLDKLVCMAITRFCANGKANCNVGAACIYHQLLVKLTAYIRTFHQSDIAKGCLLWVWVVTISSYAEIHSNGKQRPAAPDNEGVQLAREFRAAYPKTSSWSRDDYTKFAQRFFWNEIGASRLDSVLETAQRC